MDDCVPFTVATLHLPMYDGHFTAATAAENDRLRHQTACDFCRRVWDRAGTTRASVGRELGRHPGSLDV